MKNRHKIIDSLPKSIDIVELAFPISRKKYIQI